VASLVKTFLTLGTERIVLSHGILQTLQVLLHQLLAHTMSLLEQGTWASSLYSPVCVVVKAWDESNVLTGIRLEKPSWSWGE
jgi:hypothetical protein